MLRLMIAPSYLLSRAHDRRTFLTFVNLEEQAKLRPAVPTGIGFDGRQAGTEYFQDGSLEVTKFLE